MPPRTQKCATSLACFDASNLLLLQDVYRIHRETYFTPATWAYAIWSLVHVLLFGFVVYAWFPAGARTIIKGISWRFPLVAVLNAIYSHARYRGHYVVAFIVSLLVASAVSHVYYIVKRYHRSESLNDESACPLVPRALSWRMCSCWCHGLTRFYSLDTPALWPFPWLGHRYDNPQRI